MIAYFGKTKKKENQMKNRKKEYCKNAWKEKGRKSTEKLRGDNSDEAIRLGWILHRSGKNIQDFIQYDILYNIAALVIFDTGLQLRT